MSSDPMSDRAMIVAISRKDMSGLKRALASGANANKTIKKNQFEGNLNPLLIAAEYGWTESYAVLVKAGAKRRAPGGKSAVSVLAKEADSKGVAELVRVLGKLTGLEFAEALDALREPNIVQENGAENGQHQINRTFRALIEGVPDKISSKDRLRCAQTMFSMVNIDFQFAMGPRRAPPLEWVEEVGRALPPCRRLISSNTPGILGELKMFTMAAAAIDALKPIGPLPDGGERMDLMGREFAIDLRAVLEIRNSINDIAGTDAKNFESAAARQSAAMMRSKVSGTEPAAAPVLRM